MLTSTLRCLLIIVSLSFAQPHAAFASPKKTKTSARAPARTSCKSGQDSLRGRTFGWSFCVSRFSGETNGNLVFLFPGMQGNEHSWQNNETFQAVEGLWRRSSAAGTTVVTISLERGTDGLWLLAPQSSAPSSGKLDFFSHVLQPKIERELGLRIQRRYLVGQSMGGFNVTQLALRHPTQFTRVALLCPFVPAVSPFSPAEEITAYRTRFQIEDLYMDAMQGSLSANYPDTASWLASEPIALAARPGPASAPRFHIQANQADDLGLFEPATRFRQALSSRGLTPEWKSLEGGHCENLQAEPLATFLGQP